MVFWWSALRPIIKSWLSASWAAPAGSRARRQPAKSIGIERANPFGNLIKGMSQ